LSTGIWKRYWKTLKIIFNTVQNVKKTASRRLGEYRNIAIRNYNYQNTARKIVEHHNTANPTVPLLQHVAAP